MATLIEKPAIIPADGNKPKIIREHIGRVNSKTPALSVARMSSPEGWSEPGQRPEFDEFTLVLSGSVHVQHERGIMEVQAGQAVIAGKGEWVRYSTPDGAEYVAICLPAFTPAGAHRDE